MVWGPLIAAGVNLGTSLLNSRAAGKRDRALNAEMDQIPGFGRQGYQPFIDQGMQAQGQASGAYQQMLQNPTSFVDQIMQSYKPSQGYQFRQKNSLNAMRNSASSGGFAGTGYDQMQQGEMADNLASQDMQQYLQNVLGVQGTGLAGQQHVGDIGYNASGSLADYLGNAAMSKANLKYGQNKQASSNDAGMGALFGQLAGAGMQGLGSLGASRDAATAARMGGVKGGPAYDQSLHGSRLTSIFGGFK